MPARTWTEEEIEWLRQNFRFLRRREIIEKLNRRYNTIAQKAKRMGFKRDKRRKFAPPLNLTESEACYFAGVLDCDGHIGIYKRGRGDNYTPNFVLSMTLRETVDWVAEKLSLKVREITPKYEYIKKSGEASTARKQYRIETGRTDIIRNMLIELIPYLKSKKKQAINLLEFIEECKYNGHQDLKIAEKYKSKMYS